MANDLYAVMDQSYSNLCLEFSSVIFSFLRAHSTVKRMISSSLCIYWNLIFCSSSANLMKTLLETKVKAIPSSL
jgi:hypothetical protein